MTRDELLESLLVERFGTRRDEVPRPRFSPTARIVVCGGCGRFANADEPCRECRRRRAAVAAS